MKTVKQLLAEISASAAEYVMYGDDGVVCTKASALEDIATMDDCQIGEGSWEECDEEGNIL